MRTSAPLLFALLCGAAQAHAQAWQPVKGAELSALFAGASFGDGTHFSYRFDPNGTYRGTEMGKDVQGRWRTVNEQMCWTSMTPREDEECFDVERAGDEVRFLKSGSEAWAAHRN